MLTDYHVHLRPDHEEARAVALLHRRERRALPRGGGGARHRRAGRRGAHPPVHAGAGRVGAPVVAQMGARRRRRLLRVRPRADRPAARHRGRLRRRPRGPDRTLPRRARLGLRRRLGPLRPRRRGRPRGPGLGARLGPRRLRGQGLGALLRHARRGRALRPLRHHGPPRPRQGLGLRAAAARARPALLLRAGGGGDAGVRSGDGALDRRTAQARGRAVSGAGDAGDGGRRRAADRALLRRPRSRAARLPLRRRARRAGRRRGDRDLRLRGPARAGWSPSADGPDGPGHRLARVRAGPPADPRRRRHPARGGARGAFRRRRADPCRDRRPAGRGRRSATSASTSPTPIRGFGRRLARAAAHRGRRTCDERGWAIGNVDATVVLERPKLAPYRDAIRASLAAALGLPEDAVGIKATTGEGLGFVGRGEGAAAMAVATLDRG